MYFYTLKTKRSVLSAVQNKLNRDTRKTTEKASWGDCERDSALRSAQLAKAGENAEPQDPIKYH